MTNPARIGLQAIVEQVAIDVTDADGRLHKSHLSDAVLDQITSRDVDPHLQAAALAALVESEVTKFGDRRSPRRRPGGTFFHPDSFLRLGNGIWVWMAAATDSDNLQWSRLSRKNRARVSQADDELQEYSGSRADAFRVHTDLTRMIDLERLAFGWTPDNSVQDSLWS